MKILICFLVVFFYTAIMVIAMPTNENTMGTLIQKTAIPVKKFTVKKFYNMQNIIGKDESAFDPSDTSEMVLSSEKQEERKVEEEKENEDEYDEDARIFHGHSAKPNQYPYIVSIQDWTDHKNITPGQPPADAFCGGSILNPLWIVTAAHCFGFWNDPQTYDIRINAGVNNPYQYTNTSQVRRVHKVYSHPKFTNNIFVYTGLPNDIALILLTKPLVINKFVAIIKLAPVSYIPPVNSAGILTGWGAIGHKNDTDIVPNKLLHARMTVSHLDICRDQYKTIEITDNKICSNSSADHARACTGDSGGPFVQTLKGTDVLVGLVSGGGKICNEEKPNIFTRVSAYLSWINEQIKKKTPEQKLPQVFSF